MAPAGSPRPLMKKVGVECTPSEVPTAASVFTSCIALSYPPWKSETFATSFAALRTVSGLSSAWWRKNQSFSVSPVPFCFAMMYSAEASHEATKLAEGTLGLQCELSGHVLKMNFTSFGLAARYLSSTGFRPKYASRQCGHWKSANSTMSTFAPLFSYGKLLDFGCRSHHRASSEFCSVVSGCACGTAGRSVSRGNTVMPHDAAAMNSSATTSASGVATSTRMSRRKRDGSEDIGTELAPPEMTKTPITAT